MKWTDNVQYCLYIDTKTRQNQVKVKYRILTIWWRWWWYWLLLSIITITNMLIECHNCKANTMVPHTVASRLLQTICIWIICKQSNVPLNVRKRLPRWCCTVQNIFQLVSVNLSQAAVESLSLLRHRPLQTTMQLRETSQCTDVVISLTTEHRMYIHGQITSMHFIRIPKWYSKLTTDWGHQYLFYTTHGT